MHSYAKYRPEDYGLEEYLEHFDGWYNLYTGLGTSRDKRLFNEFAPNTKLTDVQLENLYHDEDMAARIVDTVPEEAMRKGISIQITNEDDPSQATEIEENVQTDLDTLDMVNSIIDAHCWARLYGGSAIVIGADDGSSEENMAEPLNEDRISKVSFLNVIEKRYCTPRQWYSNPLAPKYGFPETYFISNTVGVDIRAPRTGVEVHESRIIPFDGIRVTANRRQRNEGWGGSIIQRIHWVLRDFGTGWDSVGHLLQDGAQGVFKMKELARTMGTNNLEQIRERLAIMDMGRSIARALVLDADEESFERQSYSFAGVDKILQMFILRLSAAARMPATILMGQSPAGENATGEADFQWFYSTVQTIQKNYLRPKIERIIELILKSKEGPTKGKVPDDWNVKFEALWELNPQQTADMQLKIAQKDHIHITDGVLLPEEVTLSRYKPEGFSMETTVDLDLRREVLEFEKDREIENAKNPPTPPPGPTSTPPTEPEPVPGKEPKQDSLRPRYCRHCGETRTVKSYQDNRYRSGKVWLCDGCRKKKKDRKDNKPGPQTVAKNALNNAIRDGKIKRPTICSNDSCNSTKNIQAHHTDYSKPFQVKWLCASCHKRTQDKKGK